MKLFRYPWVLITFLVAMSAADIGNLIAGTNGFVVPTFRGGANSQSGYWEVFTVPIGAPGNRADQGGATTDAVLTQVNPGALLTGSGNIYSLGTNSFELTDSTSFPVGTIVLQTRTVGSEIDYPSVLLEYSDDSGNHRLAPQIRYELNRAAGLGFNVSTLFQWDLTGLGVTAYRISFVADGPSLSFDSLTLDTAQTFAAAFAGQPFQLRSTPANLARWMYPFNGSPGDRPTASAFGSIGSSPDYDSRDAQFLLGWTTTNRIPSGFGRSNYLIRRARLTLTLSSDKRYVYTPELRDYRTYFPTNDPRYLAPVTAGSPVELFGSGFRGGFTAATYPQDGPWGVDPLGGFHSNRVAFAAGFDINGVLVDVSNSVGDDGTNEIAGAFEVAPFAVGRSADVAPGEPMPVGSRLSFDLNLDDPLIYSYLQAGLDSGNLSFIVSSLADATLAGPPTYPSFYTIFSPIATADQVPILDLDGAIIRPGLDGDLDGLPDDWENFYFGSLIHDGVVDPDGDGASNRAEYQGGTVPTSGTSLLRILSIQHESNTTETHSSYAPGREFALQWLDEDGRWQSVPEPRVQYSSPWLSKTEANPVYPSPVSLIHQDGSATNRYRLYRIEAHGTP